MRKKDGRVAEAEASLQAPLAKVLVGIEEAASKTKQPGGGGHPPPTASSILPSLAIDSGAVALFAPV